MTVRSLMVAGMLLALSVSVRAAQPTVDIVRASGVPGGLVVQVGCVSADALATLRVSDAFLVHGLDRDAGAVSAARDSLANAGLNGRISVAQFDGIDLPYVDNLVNLLIIADPKARVPARELGRVLAPRGILIVRGSSVIPKLQALGSGAGPALTPQKLPGLAGLRCFVKPVPAEIDDWPQGLHDAGNNAVADDLRVGHPRHLQWMATPRWLRDHHKLASISSLVSSGGRLFYMVDEESGHDMGLPGRWSFQARDAFSGVLLWKRPVRNWLNSARGFRSGPMQIVRTLAATPEHVYTILGLTNPMVQLDALTGTTLQVYEGTEHLEEFVLNDGRLFVLVGDPVSENAMPSNPKFNAHPNTKRLLVFDAQSGKQLWSWKPERVEDTPIPQTLAVSGNRVFLAGDDSVFCLDRDNGKLRWRTSETMNNLVRDPWYPQKPRGSGLHSGRMGGWAVATLVAVGDVVVFSNGHDVMRLDAGTGGVLWKAKGQAGTLAPIDIFVVGKKVWVGSQPLLWAEGGYTAYHIDTGAKVSSHLDDLTPIRSLGHHHRCYRDKATTRFILDSYRGIEMLDLAGDDHSRNNWIRGMCQYGVMPANGLIYSPPHACGCYAEAKLTGFLATASGRERWDLDPAATILEKGPAYGGAAPDLKFQAPNPKRDWPTLRGSGSRAGVSEQSISAKVAEAWRTGVGSRLTAPVVASGRVLVADIESHTVHALEHATGSKAWSFTAGARVDSPPTVYNGLAIFGCRDGWVYCLRLTDGAMLWRFRAAPADMRTYVMGQLESLWPVYGAVLVQDGLVYTAAGRSTYLDDGLFLYSLDPVTGRVVHRQHLESPRSRIFTDAEVSEQLKRYPRAVKEPMTVRQNRIDYRAVAAEDQSDAFSMQGGNLNGVVSGDGKNVFLRFFTFDKDWKQQNRRLRHLYSTSSFIDDQENRRSHWILGHGDFRRLGVAYSWTLNNKFVSNPAGLMLSFSGDRSWVIRRGRGRGRGYALFCVSLPEHGNTKDGDLGGVAEPLWTRSLAVIRPRAIVKAGDRVHVLGIRVGSEPGGILQSFNAQTGESAGEFHFGSPPVWDGVAVANGRMYLSTEEGCVVCLK